jgi:hypothetical protein
MKAIYKLFALTAALAALAGCDLTMIPEDAVSPESFFHSEVEMQRWLNPLYANVLYDGPTSNNYDNFNADDLIDNYLTLIMLGTRSAADAMTGTNLWSWSALRRVNLFLQYSSNCEDEAVRSRYEGEARFFRAVIYFHKVCNFGDVPWYDHVIGSEDTEDLNAPREDRGIVMRHVMDDFDFAIEKLPVTRNLVRVNRWTALAFKARAALYEGSWRLYRGLPDAEDYLEIARDAAKEVLDCGLYSLYTKGETPYRDLFNADDIDENEVLMARKYNMEKLSYGNSLQYQWTNAKSGFTKRFMNQYLMNDGTAFTDREGYETVSFVDEFRDRDPRMAQTVLGPGYIQVGEKTVSANTLISITGYQPIKYVSDVEHDKTDRGTNDWPFMRLPEVMLNYAEARAELGELTQEDLDITVNRIRDRVKMPHLSLEAANAAPDRYLAEYYSSSLQPSHVNRGVLLEIRRERCIELVAEGQRQWDLFRWKEGAHMVNAKDRWYGVYFPGPGTYDLDGDGVDDVELYETASSSPVANKKKIGSEIILSGGNSGYIEAYSTSNYTWDEERDYLYPIPVTQRVLTMGALTQNPGWTDTYDAID